MCYGNALFKMHSGKLDKDLKYCKGDIKQHFIYTHTYIHTHTHTHTHIHRHAHRHAHTHTRAHTHTCTRAHAHTRTRAHAHTHTHTYTVDCKRWEDIVKDGKGWPPNFQPISGRRRCDFPVLK